MRVSFLWLVFLYKMDQKNFSIIIKVDTIDGPHIKTYLPGKLCSFGVICVIDKFICLSVALYYDDLSENTWTKFISFVKYTFTKFVLLNTYIISGGENFVHQQKK